MKNAHTKIPLKKPPAKTPKLFHGSDGGDN